MKGERSFYYALREKVKTVTLLNTFNFKRGLKCQKTGRILKKGVWLRICSSKHSSITLKKKHQNERLETN